VNVQFARAFGGQADAIFVVLDFLGGADDHAALSIAMPPSTALRRRRQPYAAHIADKPREVLAYRRSYCDNRARF
jgi:hypothetical protein